MIPGYFFLPGGYGIASINKPARQYTHEGAPAKHIRPAEELRRAVMACMLWEQQFYESGEDIATRIVRFSQQVDAQTRHDIAVEARKRMNIRHAPLLIAATPPQSRELIREVVQRADELTELLAIYWRDGRKPVPAQMKKGLADAFKRFDEYALAKYDRKGAVKLRDVVRLVHPTPPDKQTADMWGRLVRGELQTPDTWEVALSSGADKRETFERLMSEGKLGGMALLRNLRNMREAGVPRDVVRRALRDMRTGRILPYRFIAAAKHAQELEPELGDAMTRSVQEREDAFRGDTAIVVDISGSMHGAPVSQRSELTRMDAAIAVAMVAREMCGSCDVFSFSNDIVQVPARRTFALRAAIMASQRPGGTNLGRAVEHVNREGYTRSIVITDEQSHTRVPDPVGRGYMINVASYQNGVGYGPWLHVDGFSAAVLDYIAEYERVHDTPGS